MSEHGIMKHSWCDNLTTDTGHSVALCCTDCVYVVFCCIDCVVSSEPRDLDGSGGQRGRLHEAGCQPVPGRGQDRLPLQEGT